MYLDTLYTKLYSERNWNGLNQLISEIRQFTRADYQGLNTEASNLLRGQRDEIARRMREARNKGKGSEVVDWSQSTLPQLKADARSHAEQYHNYLTIQPTYDKYKDKGGNTFRSQYYANDTEALNKAVQDNKDRLLGTGQVGRMNGSQGIPTQMRRSNYDIGSDMISNNLESGQLPTNVSDGTYYDDWGTLSQRLQLNNKLQNAGTIKRALGGMTYQYNFSKSES